MTAADPYFSAYSIGLVHASVCTNLADDEATTRLNIEHATGVSSGWALADEDFADGHSNGVTCPDRADCRHLLFSC